MCKTLSLKANLDKMTDKNHRTCPWGTYSLVGKGGRARRSSATFRTTKSGMQCCGALKREWLTLIWDTRDCIWAEEDGKASADWRTVSSAQGRGKCMLYLGKKRWCTMEADHGELGCLETKPTLIWMPPATTHQLPVFWIGQFWTFHKWDRTIGGPLCLVSFHLAQRFHGSDIL